MKRTLLIAALALTLAACSQKPAAPVCASAVNDTVKFPSVTLDIQEHSTVLRLRPGVSSALVNWSIPGATGADHLYANTPSKTVPLGCADGVVFTETSK